MYPLAKNNLFISLLGYYYRFLTLRYITNALQREINVSLPFLVHEKKEKRKKECVYKTFLLLPHTLSSVHCHLRCTTKMSILFFSILISCFLRCVTCAKLGDLLYSCDSFLLSRFFGCYRISPYINL